MTTLITGGAGFIGSHLVDHLVARGEGVRVLDNLSAGSLSNIENLEEIEFVKGDLLDASHIRSALKDCDTVYHLAANPEVRSWKASPEDHYKQNIECTYNLLEAIRKQGVPLNSFYPVSGSSYIL